VNNAFDQSVESLPVMQSGLALPESGLPEGWTMEQWEHYGEQWMATQAESQTM
jgi:hypothetical protein